MSYVSCCGSSAVWALQNWNTSAWLLSLLPSAQQCMETLFKLNSFQAQITLMDYFALRQQIFLGIWERNRDKTLNLRYYYSTMSTMTWTCSANFPIINIIKMLCAVVSRVKKMPTWQQALKATPVMGWAHCTCHGQSSEVHCTKAQIRGDLLMECRSSPQAPKSESCLRVLS